MSDLAKENKIGKRHNPVDSIRRRINSINLREHETNPITHIPKYQCGNYEFQEGSVRRNLESLLKMQGTPNGPNYTQSHNDQNFQGTDESCAAGDLITFSSPYVPVETSTTSRRSKGEMDIMDNTMICLPERQGCSTPVVDEEDTAGVDRPTVCECSRVVRFSGVHDLCDEILRPSSDHLETCSPVRLEGSCFPPGNPDNPERADESSETSVVSSNVSFISEETFLNTIFKACDTENIGRVPVASIIEFLRHTLNCGSEDSGLQELYNMLDPDRRDLSFDMDTYQAVMCEWIEYCRKKAGDGDIAEFLSAEPSQKASVLSITVGSLEALGGDKSRMDLETSDLINCIADLQHTHKRLLEDNNKLKASREIADDVYANLVEKNDNLNAQLRNSQALLQRDKSLRDENQELKLALAKLEEDYAHVDSLNKQLKKDILQLTCNMTTLQNEVTKLRAENDILCKQEIESTTTFEDVKKQLQEMVAIDAERNNLLIEERNKHLKEMEETVCEYNCIIESLRIGKSCLEAQNLDLLEKVVMNTNENSESSSISQTTLICSSIDMEITQAEKIDELKSNLEKTHGDVLNLKPRLSETSEDVGENTCQDEALQMTTQIEQTVFAQTDAVPRTETASVELSTFLVGDCNSCTSCDGSDIDVIEEPGVPNTTLDNKSIYLSPLHSQQVHSGVRDVKPCSIIFRVIVPAMLMMLTTLGLISAITTFPHKFVPTVEHDSAYASVETLLWPYTDFQYVRRPPI